MRSGCHEAEDRQRWQQQLLVLFSRFFVCREAECMLGWPGVHAGAIVGNR